MKQSIKIIMAAALAAGPLLAQAYNNDRSERAEGFFELRYQDTVSLTTDSGSFEMEDDLGWGFGFSYNVNEHLNFGVTFSNTRADYKASALVEDKQTQAKEIKTIRHEADHYSFMFNGTYYLLRGDITPLITAGFGTSTVDTNVADGPGSTYCWYDPWYGYICDSYQNTYRDSGMTYQAGFGMRFDFARNAFVNVIYQKQWQDISLRYQNKDMEFSIISFQLGGKF